MNELQELLSAVLKQHHEKLVTLGILGTAAGLYHVYSWYVCPNTNSDVTEPLELKKLRKVTI